MTAHTPGDIFDARLEMIRLVEAAARVADDPEGLLAPLRELDADRARTLARLALIDLASCLTTLGPDALETWASMARQRAMTTYVEAGP